MKALHRERYDFKDTIVKINASGLPRRFKNKLICDLRYVEASGIEGIQCIILFGSAARGELKAASDLDLLFVTSSQIARGIRSDIDTKLDEPVDGVRTDAKFYTVRQFGDSDCLFVRQVKKDGKILWKAEER